MNSRSGSAGRPLLAHERVEARATARGASGRTPPGSRAHSLGSSAGRPEKVGATPDPLTSNGLQLTIRTYGAPLVSSAGNADDVVLDDHVRAVAGDDLAQLRLAVARPADQLLEHRPDERVQLVDASACGTPARCPARSPSRTGRRPAPAHPGAGGAAVGQVDQVLDEAQRLQLAPPGRLGGEDDPVPALRAGRCRSRRSCSSGRTRSRA